MRLTRRAMIAGAGSMAGLATTGLSLPHAVHELRIYRLHPGQRETLIALFEREFIESQEALGARIVGTFRDLDDPDRFVWIRSFADMASRAPALRALYGGPVWRAHREAANATMIDASDVYLLRPAGRTLSLPTARPPIGATPSRSLLVADIYARDDAAPSLRSGAESDPDVVATFVTEESANDFPALPVHEEKVFVTLRRLADGSAATSVPPPPLRRLRLHPTARSLLR